MLDVALDSPQVASCCVYRCSVARLGFFFFVAEEVCCSVSKVGSPAHLQASNAVLADLNLKFFFFLQVLRVQQSTWTQGPVPKGLRMVSMSLSNCR